MEYWTQAAILFVKYFKLKKRKKMKKTIQKAALLLLIGTIGLSANVLNGTRSINMMEQENRKELAKEPAYRDATVSSIKAKRVMGKQIKANYISSSVYYAVSQIAKAYGIPLDKTFKPASSHLVTMNYTGTLGGFLQIIYNESGIKYRFRNGLLSVFNQDDVERAYATKKCGKGNSTVNIKLNGVSPADVFKHFSKNYKFNFSFRTKYYDLSGSETPAEGKTSMPEMSFYYSGCDKIDALRNFSKAADLRLEVHGNNVVVHDYETAELDIPTYFNVDFSAADEGLGGGAGSQGSSGGGGGGGGTSTNTISNKEDMIQNFTDYLSKYISLQGRVYVSPRGYVTVTDRPSIVKEIRKLVRSERRRQTAINLSVSIIRVNVKDEFSMGVDWSTALNSLAGGLGYKTLGAAFSYAGEVGGGIAIGGMKDGVNNLVQAMQVYGSAKIVRNYHVQTRSGIISTFKAVEQIPYITTSVVTNQSSSEIATEARVAEAGVVISIIPTLTSKGEIVNLAMSVKISEYQGDKIFKVKGDEYSLPKISTNNVNMPARVHLNDTVILTGLKLKTGSMSKDGVPGLSQIPGIFGGLFGFHKKETGVADFLIVVTPKSVEEY